MMEKLKELRIKNNYTFQQMADFLDISKAYYWQLEHDRRGLYYLMAVRIAEIFKLKPDDIFYEEMKDK